MSSHTPGPWAVANVGWVASLATDQTICGMYAVKSGFDHTETDANARLIAAAPDLLEALGQTLNAMIHLELSDSSKIEWEASKAAAYAAIAKATGGAA